MELPGFKFTELSLEEYECSLELATTTNVLTVKLRLHFEEEFRDNGDLCFYLAASDDETVTARYRCNMHMHVQ